MDLELWDTVTSKMLRLMIRILLSSSLRVDCFSSKVRWPEIWRFWSFQHWEVVCFPESAQPKYWGSHYSRRRCRRSSAGGWGLRAYSRLFALSPCWWPKKFAQWGLAKRSRVPWCPTVEVTKQNLPCFMFETRFSKLRRFSSSKSTGAATHSEVSLPLEHILGI